MRILAFSASLRHDSLNGRLIAIAARLAREAGAEVDLADFSELVMPNYNFDVEQQGFPEACVALGRRVESVDGLLISTPEYNHSFPGTLKNTIDWLSRLRPMPLRGRSVQILSAAPSLVGGNRAAEALSTPLEVLGMHVMPDRFSLNTANEAFGADGELLDPQRLERLQGVVDYFLRVTQSLKLMD
ncbi:NAD(P)H-dependent oxidoreductase [bacterium]|nr:NAD(P)H-dependent oxidoreductase [bacterium]